MMLNAKLSATESPTLFATVQNTHDIIRLARIPVSEARPDRATGRRVASATDLVSVDEEEWQTAVKRFSILKQASSYNLPLDRRP